MSIKNRLQQLEKQARTQPTRADVFMVRKLNYRAGIVQALPEPLDAIPLRVVVYDQTKGQPQGNGIFIPDNGKA